MVARWKTIVKYSSDISVDVIMDYYGCYYGRNTQYSHILHGAQPSVGKKKKKKKPTHTKTTHSIEYIVGIYTTNVIQLALKMWVWVWGRILTMDETVTEFWFCDLHFHFVRLLLNSDFVTYIFTLYDCYWILILWLTFSLCPFIAEACVLIMTVLLLR